MKHLSWFWIPYMTYYFKMLAIMLGKNIGCKSGFTR